MRSNAGLYYSDRDEFVECLNLLVRDDRLRAALGLKENAEATGAVDEIERQARSLVQGMEDADWDVDAAPGLHDDPEVQKVLRFAAKGGLPERVASHSRGWGEAGVAGQPVELPDGRVLFQDMALIKPPARRGTK